MVSQFCQAFGRAKISGRFVHIKSGDDFASGFAGEANNFIGVPVKLFLFCL